MCRSSLHSPLRSSLSAVGVFPLLVALSMASFGCSDPDPQQSTGPRADGAFHVVFGTATGSSCIIKPHVGQVGAVTESKIGELKTSAEDGADVTCSVSGSAGEYVAQASIAMSGMSLNIDLPALTLSATEANPALGSAVFVSSETVKPYTSTPAQPCEFFFTANEEVASGRLWLSFRCPLVENASTASSCALHDSVLAVQNCSN